MTYYKDEVKDLEAKIQACLVPESPTSSSRSARSTPLRLSELDARVSGIENSLISIQREMRRIAVHVGVEEAKSTDKYGTADLRFPSTDAGASGGGP